mgnify:CR=1 FL=1
MQIYSGPSWSTVFHYFCQSRCHVSSNKRALFDFWLSMRSSQQHLFFFCCVFKYMESVVVLCTCTMRFLPYWLSMRFSEEILSGVGGQLAQEVACGAEQFFRRAAKSRLSIVSGWIRTEVSATYPLRTHGVTTEKLNLAQK